MYLSTENCYVNSDSSCPLKCKKEYNLENALENLPPLIRGYLSLGAKIGDGVYIDKDFNSLDVLIILKIKDINERYLKRFLRD